MLIQLAPGWVFKMRTDSLPRGQSKNYVLFFFVYKERVLTKIQPSCGNICKKYKDKKLHKQNLNKIYRPYWTPDCGRCEDLPNFSSLCIPLWWQQPRRGAWFELIWVTFYFSVGSFGNAREPDTSWRFCGWRFVDTADPFSESYVYSNWNNIVQ